MRTFHKRRPLDLPILADLRHIHGSMRGAGQDLFVVGGAVRDALLGHEPKDYDLATGADPDKVIEILSQHGQLSLDLTGKSFGVVRVKTPDRNEYEIATYRKDIGAGRRPDAVEFTTIEEDVRRRDFTINALFFDIETEEMVDFVGGEEDLHNRVIRTVGDPHERFAEDKLRVLRAVRFVGRLDGTLDPTTAQAIRENPDLGGVSEERIREEFFKGLGSSVSVVRFLELMHEMGLLQEAFPTLALNTEFSEVRLEPLQLALLLRDNDLGEITNVLKRMKHTNLDIKQALFLLQMRELEAERAPLLRKTQKATRTDPGMLLAAADHLGAPTRHELRRFLQYLHEPPAATGNEMAAQGLKGKAIGDAIREAEIRKYRSLDR